MLSGILNIDKPSGWTSHDVVARVRRLIGQKRVGHAGTLDPLATGVLLVCIGHATKLSSYLMDSKKIYVAEIVLGAITATDDAEAPLESLRPVGSVTEVQLRQVLSGFVGEIEQVPPAYAAIKQDGRKLYELARAGIEVERVARPVTIHELEMLAWESPRLTVRVMCGSGTYIRALARDIGEALGIGGYLDGLRRIQSGVFRVEDAISITELDSETVRSRLLHFDRAVFEFPALILSEQEVKLITDGASVEANADDAEAVRLYGPDGTFKALARIHDGSVRAFRVFN